MPAQMIHDPQARLDYIWDWGNWLDIGETIDTIGVSVLPNETDEMIIESSSHTPSTVTAWVSGGMPGRTYALTCHVVTSMNRQDDRSFKLSVKNR